MGKNCAGVELFLEKQLALKCEKTKFDFGEVRQQRWRLKKMHMCVSVGVCVRERECLQGGWEWEIFEM